MQVCNNEGMKTNMKKKKGRTSNLVGLRDTSYQRLRRYQGAQEIPASLTVMVSVAVDQWLDRLQAKK